MEVGPGAIFGECCLYLHTLEHQGFDEESQNLGPVSVPGLELLFGTRFQLENCADNKVPCSVYFFGSTSKKASTL